MPKTPAPIRRRSIKQHVPGLSERLSALRAKADVSLHVLAVQSGVSVCTIRDAQNFSIATPETVSLLASALGVSATALADRNANARAANAGTA